MSFVVPQIKLKIHEGIANSRVATPPHYSGTATRMLASRSDEKLRAVFFKITPPLEDVSHPRHALAFFFAHAVRSYMKYRIVMLKVF